MKTMTLIFPAFSIQYGPNDFPLRVAHVLWEESTENYWAFARLLIEEEDVEALPPSRTAWLCYFIVLFQQQKTQWYESHISM